MSDRSIAYLKQRVHEHGIELADLAIQRHDDLSPVRRKILDAEIARVERIKCQEEIKLEQAELDLEAMRLSWF